MSKTKFLVISGTNSNLVVGREAFECDSWQNIHAALDVTASHLGIAVDCHQFSHKDDIVDCLRRAPEQYAGVVINAAGMTDYGDALRNAIGSMLLPCVEVFDSGAHKLEDSGHNSVIAAVCLGVIGGFGQQSYILALQALVHLSEQ
ncbi:MAG: type II 3-dehydroquinate dehydratase [Gammaproteobacteria bacterium]|jgi:3-dehydroquinate dehydratase-2|nr:type II 3-dehydroquinate dehydratase [Gammaproteobacteria bacterium]